MSVVTGQMTAPWNETIQPTLPSSYKPENIFNVDEFGLPHQCLPTKTYHPSGEKCPGRHLGKSYVYFGKSTKLQCFKKIKQLPCRYRSQKKSWMTRHLFGEWVRKLHSSFRAQDRKVIILIDNYPAHPEVKNLTNINLIFLPPNTTSVHQPRGQDVIRGLEAHYRRRIVRLCFKALDEISLFQR